MNEYKDEGFKEINTGKKIISTFRLLNDTVLLQRKVKKVYGGTEIEQIQYELQQKKNRSAGIAKCTEEINTKIQSESSTNTYDIKSVKTENAYKTQIQKNS